MHHEGHFESSQQESLEFLLQLFDIMQLNQTENTFRISCYGTNDLIHLAKPNECVLLSSREEHTSFVWDVMEWEKDATSASLLKTKDDSGLLKDPVRDKYHHEFFRRIEYKEACPKNILFLAIHRTTKQNEVNDTAIHISDSIQHLKIRGILVRHGSNAQNGHYTCFVSSPDSFEGGDKKDTWFEYDDAQDPVIKKVNDFESLKKQVASTCTLLYYA
jgi:hypothetical protein